MNIIISSYKNIAFAEIKSDKIEIREIQDALEFIVNANYQGSDILIARKENFTDDFFDLKTTLAGEILQKFSNYRTKLAIIGDFSNVGSKSFKDFIYESNKKKQTVFVSNLEEALNLLIN